MGWLEVVGWTGSVLVVVSLMQARVLRFRVMNLAGAVIATVYNVVIDVWPFAAMNGAIAVIDVYWLVRLLRERHDERVYGVVEVAPDDAYLAHVLAVHADDIAQFRTAPSAASARDGASAEPAGSASPVTATAPSRSVGGGPGAAFLVVRGDETVGVVLVSDEGDGVGRVDLDWVTPRFRDFTPGEFVYRRSGVFAAHGLRRLVTRPAHADREYLQRVGFRPAADGWEREVEPAAA